MVTEFKVYTAFGRSIRLRTASDQPIKSRVSVLLYNKKTKLWIFPTYFVSRRLNTMLLFTNCEVHTSKYSDCSFDERTEWDEIRTKTKVWIFSVWNKQFVNERFIVWPHELVGKFSGVVGKVLKTWQNNIPNPFLWKSDKKYYHKNFTNFRKTAGWFLFE